MNAKQDIKKTGGGISERVIFNKERKIVGRYPRDLKKRGSKMIKNDPKMIKNEPKMTQK